MKELNELVERAKNANFEDAYVLVNPNQILAIAESFREMEQRAEAAEAEVKHQLNVNALVCTHHQKLIAERDALQARLAKFDEAGRKLSLEWVYEDELPEGYPYDEMFQFSKVDIVRMFPVFVTVPAPAADLADLEKQEPYLIPSLEHFVSFWKKVQSGNMKPGENEISHTLWLLEELAKTELFTRPAPAADLAELVPKEMPPALRDQIIDICDGFEVGDSGALEIWEACRAAMLRNIEELNK